MTLPDAFLCLQSQIRVSGRFEQKVGMVLGFLLDASRNESH